MITKQTQPTIILGIETTTNICSAALWDGQRLWQEVTETARSHSKTLLPMVEAVLHQANLQLSSVQAIACARGPGSFTGVRIGVGVAKGLAFGQDIGIIPISPLQAIAYRSMKLEKTSAVTALMDARMGELYAADYVNENGIAVLKGQEKLTNIAAIAVGKQVFAGTGMQEYRQALTEKQAKLSRVIFPYAEDVLELARKLPIQPVSTADFRPVYLRDKVVD
ncbi:MAG: tRNA (adenosine(37)-N6)-threonylcarbamoyltransferase complex dimerization subunit type 1 TsaB [Gammaproteobacteria bacterium]|nr:MAG: tRNA (adenosine(37)-N6)-threonylcarbamoyltransferase complex dimerization subunit type 1 TsaB [Gammaproteobacteria bacterium]